MKLVGFNAKCPFELGDKVKHSGTGEVATITDIACIHYVRSGKIEFVYELNDNGKYIAFGGGK